GGVRPDGRQYREALPTPGRDRHPVLRNDRLRNPHRQRGDNPPTRLNGAGAGEDRGPPRKADQAGRLALGARSWLDTIGRRLTRRLDAASRERVPRALEFAPP